MKLSIDDSGDISPQFQRTLGSLTGLIRDISITRPERGAPVIFTSHIDTGQLTQVFDDRDGHREIEVSGKGWTRRQCQMGTVGEALERYALAGLASDDHHQASYDDIATSSDSQVIPKDYLQRLTEPQIDALDSLQAFSSETMLDWVTGTDLTTGSSVKVPTQLLAGLPPSSTSDPCFLSTTNGVAVGQSLSSATLGGLLEFIERDAFLRIWHRQEPPALVQVPEGTIRDRFQDRLQSDALEFHLFHLPSPLSVPVVGCAILDNRDVGPSVVIGCGAALDTTAAIDDALLEGVQSYYYATYLLSEAESYPQNPREIYDFEQNVLYYSQEGQHDAISFLWEGQETAAPSCKLSGLSDLLSRFADEQITPLAVDLTLPDIADLGAHAVAVFIPELLDLSRPALPHRDHPAISDIGICPDPHPLP